MEKEMVNEDRIEHYKKLHNNLLSLVADMVSSTRAHLTDVSVMDLINWSHEQTITPKRKT